MKEATKLRRPYVGARNSPRNQPAVCVDSIGSASAARAGLRSAAFPALAVFSLESPPRYAGSHEAFALATSLGRSSPAELNIRRKKVPRRN